MGRDSEYRGDDSRDVAGVAVDDIAQWSILLRTARGSLNEPATHPSGGTDHQGLMPDRCVRHADGRIDATHQRVQAMLNAVKVATAA